MLKKVYFLFLVLFLLIANNLSAQVEQGLIGHINFDSCTIAEAGKKFTGSSVGPLTCECGVINKAVSWNGGLNFATWDASTLTTLFENDFTVSFYFKPDLNSTGVLDILSKRSKCGIDSLFAIRYLADQHTLAADIIGRVDNIATLSASLPPNHCWYFVSFTKQGQKISLYINGEEKDTKTNNYTIQVKNSGKVSLANSPCLGVTDTRYKGTIDELKFYNKALSRDQIKQQFTATDKLITRDTIIVRGGTVAVRVNPSCASSFQWFPSANVSDPTKQKAILSPTQTTLYYLKSDLSGCSIRDSIKITVVDQGALDCNTIFIPNAFTPNGDGRNDVFRVTNHYVLPPDITFEIFDRWGAKIFIGKNNTSTWDGNFNGQSMNPGLYVYHLRYNCNGSNKHKSGSFKLIR